MTTHDCHTCRNMHAELMPDGCAADEYIAMTEPEQYIFWQAATMPCQFWTGGKL